MSLATKPEHLIISSSLATRWTWPPPPSTSHTEGRNTTGTSGDLQSAEYYPKLIGSRLLTNRLSVTSWHSLAFSWHTNMASSKDSLKRASKGPNYFSSVNYVTFYRPELHILPIQLHLIQNRHDSTSIYTALTHPQTHTPTQYTHTACSPSQCTLPRPTQMFLLDTLMAGGRWHRQPTLIFYWTLFVLFILLNICTAANCLTHSLQLNPSNIPDMSE